MKIKLSIALRKISLKVIQKWQKIFCNNKDLNISAILCYHDISEKEWDWSVTPVEFEDQIKYLLKVGRIVRLDKLIRSGKENRSLFTITFDDGYESVYKNAFPILEKYNVKATVFILGKGKHTDLLSEAELLNEKQIKKLRSAGWQIGYHSKIHSNLNDLADSDLVESLVIDKNKLEKNLSLNFRYFSYPFGRYSKKAKKVLKNEGYKAAFTIEGSEYKNKSDLYRIPRVTIDKHLYFTDFKTLFTSEGLKFNNLFTKLLNIKDRLQK
ncbi:polysaccharide deacetylase family protein [Candidatus Woesebacteria bacterium]|nr:polysaccharide deacetylase family protein [Candidatus Woesebacteria bacterium]